MKITREILDPLKLPKDLFLLALAPYMECPPGEHPYVMQHHWRGASVHVDWRMKVNHYLLGWTILDNPSGTPTVASISDAKRAEETVPFVFKAKNKNLGKRCETKAKQPSVWLKVQGVVPPGGVGATKTEKGVFYIFDKGVAIFGAQKCFSYNTKIIAQDKQGNIRRESIGQVVKRKEKVKILTPSGFKPIKHYIIKPRNGKVLKISLENGSTMIVDENHPTFRLSEGIIEKILSKDLRQGDLIPIGEGYEGRGGTYELGKFLGLYLAEGSITTPNQTISFALNEDEKDLVRFLINFGTALGASYRIDKNSYSKGISLVFSKAGSLLGIVKQFTKKNKALRSCVFGLAKECRKGIIDGVTLGDGSCYRTYKTIEMGGNHQRLMKDLFELCLSINNISSFRDLKKRWKVSHSLSNFKKGNWHQYKIKDQIFIRVKKIEEKFRNSERINNLYDVELEEDHRIVLAEGIITSNTYYHEYFVKSSIGKAFPKDWTRIIIRRVGVPVLGPRKRPLKTREVMWRVMIPGTQLPYQLSRRAREKGFKPPKGNPVLFPEKWAMKNFPKEYSKWKERKKEEKTGQEKLVLPFGYKDIDDCIRKNKGRKDANEYCKSLFEEASKGIDLSTAKFTLHYLSWMGQFVIRGTPRREWYLRIDDKGSGKIRSFFFPYDPIYYEPTSGEDEGRIERKWLDFEGKIAPRTKYNPNKKITAYMEILDKGTVKLSTKTEGSIETIDLDFKGKKLKGKWRLTQEEKRASTYTFEKLSEILEGLTFVLHRHWIPLKKNAKFPEDYGHHWDVRISNGTEFNLYKDPRLTKIEEEIRARRKTCTKIKEWMAIKKQHTFKLVGPLPTYVDPLDEGKIEIYEDNQRFMSMKFFGKELKGYFVYIRKPSGEQVFERARLPSPKMSKEIEEESVGGDPSSGTPYSPFRVEKKKGWDHFWLHIYNPEKFTRCVSSPEEYIPKLKDKPPEILEVLLCLYPRPGTVHGVRVQSLKVSEEWTPDKATEWIKKNKLDSWKGIQIRKKRELSEDPLEKAYENLLEEIERKLQEKKNLGKLELAKLISKILEDEKEER